MMVLSRIPFVVANMMATHIAMSPPNKDPDVDEKTPYGKGKKRDKLSRMFSTGWYLPLCRIITHLIAMAEVYIILASLFPPMTSPKLLSFLLPPGAPPLDLLPVRIRVTSLCLVGTALCIAGSLLRISCYHHLGRYFTFQLALRKDHKLVTSGPYSIVRHPSYLGFITYAVGFATSQFGRGSWWVEGRIWSLTIGKIAWVWWFGNITFVIISLIITRVPREEKVLRETFGKEWEEWSKRTPYKVLPGLY